MIDKRDYIREFSGKNPEHLSHRNTHKIKLIIATQSRTEITLFITNQVKFAELQGFNF